MAEDQRLSAVEYIDRFFDELREEIRSNPRLAARLVKALGGNVVFEDETKSEVSSPMVLAAGPRERFYAVYSPMKAAELKKLLKSHNLATSVDMTGKNQSQLLDMMYARAAAKVSERKSSIF